MRVAVFVVVLSLAACGSSVSDLSRNQPNVDVARAALRGGSPQAALGIVSGVIARDPSNAGALIVQGDALTAEGRYDEARLSYDAVLRRDRSSVGAELGLARLQLSSNPAAAEALFLRILRQDPRNTIALNDLGVARDLQNRHQEAQVAYRQALGIDPRDSAAQVNLALSLAMTGNAEDGVRLLQPLADNPGASPQLRHDLAAALAMAGRRDEAARILSADLSPDEVRQAVDAYVSARAVQ